MSHELQRRPRRLPRLRPKLQPGIVYTGDNGSLMCVHCAGATAKFTGRDLSGHPVTAMTQEDADEWMRVMGVDLACEGGCTIHKPTPGVTYSEAHARAVFGSDEWLNAISVATAIES